VVTPNPDLGWDQVGLPTAVLLELCGDEIGRWLERKTESRDLLERITASTFAGSCPETPVDWRWMKSGKDESLLESAYAMVKEYYRENPAPLPKV
jgi:hypothetical protein